MVPLFSEAKKLFDAGQFEQAEDVCDRILQFNSTDDDTIHLRAAIHARRGESELAIPWFERAIEIRPTAERFTNLSVALRSLGQFAEAEKACREALQVDPGFVRAFQYMAELRRYSDPEELVPEIRKTLAVRKLSMADQAHLHFAAAKVLDDCSRYEDAFHHVQLGNSCHTVTVDPARLVRRFRKHLEVFTPKLVDRYRGLGHESRRPIFVIGMPRSGTSLVEQILSSHPDVFGAGELPDVPAIARALAQYSNPPAEYPDCMAKLTINLPAIAQGYLNRVATMNDTAERFVDKLPGNFEYLPLLALIFPNAVFLHCRREAMDTCLSCYFQNFASGHDYAFSQVHLGTYYRLYEKLMAAWQTLLPGRIHEVVYERIVARPEEESKQIVEKAGLAWDAACLAPHRNKRPVSTASSWQVRQPIYNRSVGRWRNYADFLGPLKLALSRDPLA
jgi:hypothetical protein